MDPSLDWRFDLSPGFVDPRAIFARASTAQRVARSGLLVSAPANVLRPQFEPWTGRLDGALIERQTTNLLLRSEEFDNAAWTKTLASVTANAIADPTGAVGADLVSGTAAGALVSQAVTTTADRGISLSVYAKAAKGPWLYAVITDGTNSASAWFNLQTGSTVTGPATGGTITFQRALAQRLKGGWFRCMLEATTATSTAWTAQFAPAQSATAGSGNLASVYLWGAQLEAEAAQQATTSYVPTTSATVTRNADNLYIPGSARWFNQAQGTVVLEAKLLPASPGLGQAVMLGGIGDTFTNTIYVSRFGSASIGCTFNSATGNNTLSRTYAFTPDGLIRVAFAWGTNDIALCVNGGNPTTAAGTFLLAGSNHRLGIGLAPFGTSSATSVANAIMRAVRVYPFRLTNTDLITLTQPT